MNEPCPISDADLLAWAVVLEYRRRQTHEGLKVLLLTFPPCPTCKEPVTEAQTWWIQDPIRYDSVITMQPCGHSHRATAADMERIHDHATEMLDSLRRGAPDYAAGRSVVDIVREARARLGEPDQTATEATLPNSWVELRRRVAKAIHRYDYEKSLSGNDIPGEHHRGEADAVLAELKQELDALAEYENTINWMTTCTSCARVLDSCIRETERAERAEAEVAAARKFAGEMRDFCSPHGVATGYADRLIEAMDRAKEGR